MPLSGNSDQKGGAVAKGKLKTVAKSTTKTSSAAGAFKAAGAKGASTKADRKSVV